MKCVTCGEDFEGKKELKTIKVTLSNPGDVFCEAQHTSCPKCKESYVEGEDIFDMARKFDKAYKEKHK